MNGRNGPRTNRRRVSHPWRKITLSRTDIAELCDVNDREATGDSFDYAGFEAGQIYVTYDAEPESFGRDMDAEERVYTAPDYQTALIESPLSHLSARGTDDGLYRVYGYNSDGPSAEKRMI